MSVIEWRAIERIIATLAGVLFVYLGYRLFLKLPERTEGEGRFTLPGDISIYISRVGPGGFLGLFGTGIIIACFYFSLTMYPPQRVDSSEPNTAPRRGAPLAPGFIQYLGGSGATLLMSRANVAGDIYTLNQVRAGVRGNRIDVNPDDLEQAITRIKLALMWSIWGDGGEWGDYAKFRAWIENPKSKSQPIPPEFSEPAAFFDPSPIKSP